jgi:hypothetical protein
MMVNCSDDIARQLNLAVPATNLINGGVSKHTTLAAEKTTCTHQITIYQMHLPI